MSDNIIQLNEDLIKHDLKDLVRSSVEETLNALLDKEADELPSLTLVKAKSGYKPSNYAGCSHFLFGNDLCYFFTSSVLVLFIMLRMADFEINS
jgi:hypothetical protein